MHRAVSVTVVLLLGAGSAACGGGTPKLGDVEAQVFTPSCTFSSCHSGAGQKGLNLQSPTWAKIVQKPAMESPKPLVAPGNPDGSYLMDKLLGRSLPMGPPTDVPWTQMPSTGGPLETSRIQLVRDWIAGGAKND